MEILSPEPAGEEVPGILPQAPTYHCQLEPEALLPPTTFNLAVLPQHNCVGPEIDVAFLFVSVTLKVMVAHVVVLQNPSALTK
jgi:hypothetical protein